MAGIAIGFDRVHPRSMDIGDLYVYAWRLMACGFQYVYAVLVWKNFQ